jgi:lipopolysaccharide/colanic/teichoic acid biosynthesis glycosyltransferase
MTPWLRRRSVLDSAAALVLGAVVSPVLAVLVVMVRRHDSGPALIRLERVGRHGRRFQQWKLRTMRSDGDLGRSAGAQITGAEDPRVTELGRSLRKWRLDELPQIINVIVGDMALVGPRPETPSYVDLDDPRWQEVLTARPGIAGPSQVLVADWEADFVAQTKDQDAYGTVLVPLKLAIDSWYLRNASPWIDLLIVIALVQRFFGDPSRTALYARVATDVPAVSLLLAPRPSDEVVATLGTRRASASDGH